MSLNLVNIHGSIEGDYEIIKTLPNNPSNGDVIKALFPNCIIKETDAWAETNLDTDTVFNKHWWDAPYKENVQ